MPEIADAILLVGGVAASALLPALLGGLKWPDRGVWPAPPVGSARSFAFWSLFRTLNVATLALAAFRPAEMQPQFWQIAALAGSAVFGALYARTLWELGRDATYCRASGLATGGVYRWTRNPQYAAAIVAFVLLALGIADSGVAILSASLIAVYALMAFAEEPWLRQRYGAAYDSYRKQTPRFFNTALLWRVIIAEIRARRRVKAAARKS